MFAYTCFDTHISLKYVRHEEGTLRAEAVEAGRSKPDVRPEASAQRDVVNRITWIFQGLATWERYLQRRLLLFSPLVSQSSSRLSCIIPCHNCNLAIISRMVQKLKTRRFSPRAGALRALVGQGRRENRAREGDETRGVSSWRKLINFDR